MNFSVVFGIHLGGSEIYKGKNWKELHYGLLNIVLQIIYDGWFYCFCEKYAGCIQSKWGEKKHCPVSKLQIDFSNIEERADCPQIDFDELTKISDELFSVSGRMLWSWPTRPRRN